MRRLVLLPLAALLPALVRPLPAQVPPGFAVVALTGPGTPATALGLVDLPGSGAVGFLPGFSSDHLPPLAVTVDPANRQIVLALQEPGGTSRVVRLSGDPGAPALDERLLARLTGEVTDLEVAATGDVHATVTGGRAGLWRVGRQGGAAVPVVVLGGTPSAANGFGIGTSWMTVVVDGAAGPVPTDPGVLGIDLDSGAVNTTFTFPGYRPRRMTGMVELATGVPRFLFTHPDGSVALSTAYGIPQVLPLPNLGAGTTVAMNAEGGGLPVRPLVLGGSAHPYLKTFDPFAPTAWTIVSGRLPGNPVDFGVAPGAVPATMVIGEPCGRVGGRSLRAWAGGSVPAIGNGGFAVLLNEGPPGALALFALGFRDDAAAGGTVRLPFALPGGCPLLVDPVVTSLHVTDGLGRAQRSLPVPNDPSLAGTVFYAQWLEAPGGTVITSDVVVGHVF